MLQRFFLHAHLGSQHKDRIRLLCPVLGADIGQAQREAAARLERACSARYAARQIRHAHHHHWPVPVSHGRHCAGRLCTKAGAPAKTAEAGSLLGHQHKDPAPSIHDSNDGKP